MLYDKIKSIGMHIVKPIIVIIIFFIAIDLSLWLKELYNLSENSLLILITFSAIFSLFIPYLNKVKKMTPKWELLKNLENNPIVRSAFIWLIVVPISARLFGSLNEKLIINYRDIDYIFHLSLPFSWQLFFYSACFYTLANMVVKVWCPNIIMEHRDYSDFSGSGKSWPQIHGYLIKMFYSNEKFSFKKESKFSVTSYLKIYHPQYFKEELPDSSLLKILQNMRTGEEDENQAYFYVRTIADRNALFFRFLASSLYFIGFVFFTYVAYQNVKFVIALTLL